MIITRLAIPNFISIEPGFFSDKRGFFIERFSQKVFKDATGLSPPFVQDNQSKSSKGVLRGLHCQLPPKEQGKLVCVVQREVFDEWVGIRERSPTLAQLVSETLTAENKKQLRMPERFAHGYLTLLETPEFLYKTTDYYAFELERCIRWKDPDIYNEWNNSSKPFLSEKDAQTSALINAEVFV